MTAARADIAIIGAGMAGASLAAAIGGRARVILIEGEAHPGYHATGRSAAFWSETYGGPLVQPLTRASRAALEDGGFLRARGCLHIADAGGHAALAALAADFADGSVALRPVDRDEARARVPGLAARFDRGLEEPSCRDIDVGGLHGAMLARARRDGVGMMTGARVMDLRRGDGWTIATTAGTVTARIVVDAAGAWAGAIADLAGAARIAITPYRRTVVQLAVAPAVPADLPLVMEARGRFYFKPEAGGRLWVSPHDETSVVAHDVAPEELDVARAIDRLEHAVDWRVERRERAWAGLRSFAPDRLPVYGFDETAPGFFWFAGQGGFGIQTAPAAAMLGAALILGGSPPDAVRAIDPERYAPGRFRSPGSAAARGSA